MSHPNLETLIGAAEFIIKEIVAHPDFQVLEYQPDLTIGDAQAAISYLKYELERNQQGFVPPETST